MKRVIAITFDGIEDVLGMEDLEVSNKCHSGDLENYVQKIILGCNIDCMPSFYDYKYREFDNEYEARTIELSYDLKPEEEEITDIFFYIRSKSHFDKKVSLLVLDEGERYCLTSGEGESWDNNY